MKAPLPCAVLLIAGLYFWKPVYVVYPAFWIGWRAKHKIPDRGFAAWNVKQSLVLVIEGPLGWHYGGQRNAHPLLHQRGQHSGCRPTKTLRNWALNQLHGGPVIIWSVFYKIAQNHDDVIKWNHFPRYWPFVRGIHRSPVNSPHKGQWRGALMFSLICAWIND